MQRMMVSARTCSVVFCATIVSASVPLLAHAQVSQITFTSEPQAISANTLSAALTIQSRSASGESAPVPQTSCVALLSSSASGKFYSSTSATSPSMVLTMSKNTSNKNFYYQDSAEGAHTLTARLALKPESETRSCGTWPLAEWGTMLDATQSITIGVTQQAPASQSQASSTQSTTTPVAVPAPVTPVSSYVPPPLQTLFADAGLDRVEIVGADVMFRGRAYTRAQTIVDQVRYVWNFGDGATAEGETVLHHYDFPGRYAVTLTVAQDRNSGSDRAIITAEPARLGFVVHGDGSVEIVNTAGRDLDLSRWHVVRGFGRFTLPEETFLLAASSLRIAHGTLGFRGDALTELQYPNGVRALGAGESTAPASTPAPAAEFLRSEAEEQAPLAVPAPSPAVRQVVPPPAPPVLETEEQARDEAAASSSTTSPGQAAAAGSAASLGSPWFWGLSAILGIGALAGVALKAPRRSEWEIEEGEDTV